MNSTTTKDNSKHVTVSYLEQSNWALTQLTDAGNINMFTRIKIPNADNNRLVETIFSFVKNNPPLRGTYSLINGKVKKIIAPFNQKLISIASLQIEDSQIDLFIEEKLQNKLPLDLGILCKFFIIDRTSTTELVIIFNKIIFDGSNHKLVRNMILHLYNGTTEITTKTHLELGELEEQYLKSEMGIKTSRFWKKKLSTIVSNSIYGDFPNQATELPSCTYHDSFNFQVNKFCNSDQICIANHFKGINALFQIRSGKKHSFCLDKFTDLQLREYAIENNLSLHVLISSIFAIWVKTFSFSQDIIIGNCVSVRDFYGLHDSIGAYTNIVFTKSSRLKDQKITDYIKKNVIEFFLAYKNRATPWEKVLFENNIPPSHINKLFFDLIYQQCETKLRENFDSTEEGHIACFDLNAFIQVYPNRILFEITLANDLFHTDKTENRIAKLKTIFKETTQELVDESFC